MKWFRINKANTLQPDGTKYNDHRWKEALAREARHQCVYCSIHENQMGGIRAFHVEHYKPKKDYPELTHVMSNLFYACPVCNSFKKDDWPCDPCPQHSRSGYPDPSKVDYNDLFIIKDYQVQGRNVAGRYMVERLYLNRPHLIVMRRWLNLLRRLHELEVETQKIITQLQRNPRVDATDLLLRLFQEQLSAQTLQRKVNDARTYTTQDITRPKKL